MRLWFFSCYPVFSYPGFWLSVIALIILFMGAQDLVEFGWLDQCCNFLGRAVQIIWITHFNRLDFVLFQPAAVIEEADKTRQIAKEVGDTDHQLDHYRGVPSMFHAAACERMDEIVTKNFWIGLPIGSSFDPATHGQASVTHYFWFWIELHGQPVNLVETPVDGLHPYTLGSYVGKSILFMIKGVAERMKVQ